jgi:hypothetical protein
MNYLVMRKTFRRVMNELVEVFWHFIVKKIKICAENKKKLFGAH